MTNDRAHTTRPDYPVIDGQNRLATRKQLLDAGWGYRRIDSFAHTHGQELFPGVLVPTRYPPARDVLLRGASIWAGHRALLTASGALEVRGFLKPAQARALVFLVPAPAWCTQAGPDAIARIVKTRRPMPEAETVRGIPLAPFARCLVDVARYQEMSPTSVRGLTIRALQAKLVTPGEVREEIAGGPRNHTKPVRTGIEDFEGGAWSLAEANLRRCVDRCGLRRMISNPILTTENDVFIGRPDGYFDEGVAVQLHSREHHSGEDADGASKWEETVAHDADYAAHNILVVGVAPTAVVRSPSRFVAQLRASLASRQGLPRPRVVVKRLVAQ